VLFGRVSVSRAGQRRNARGLLGRSGLDEDEGLLLSDATGTIHMFFMRFPIDAVFLTRDLRVVRVVEGLRPWRVAHARGARRILEIAAGQAAARGIRVGDALRLDDAFRED
jgi:uncharacterized protein